MRYAELHCHSHWERARTHQGTQASHGVRVTGCCLPVTRPWPHPLEPTWVQGKQRVADRADRVCATYGCPRHPHLIQPPAKQAKTQATQGA